jgi:uncharacterized protein (DUF433 family)
MASSRDRGAQGGGEGATRSAEARTTLPLPRVLVPHPHVRCDGQVLAGSPHVIGTRVPVRRLWAWYRGGTTVETLVRRYPNLGPARVLDALAFAYDNPEVMEADVAREQALFEKKGGPTPGARPLAQLTLDFDAETGAEREEEDAPPPPPSRSPRSRPARK